MTGRSIALDITGLEIPIDHWSAPFWAAAGAGELRFPRCGDCGHFRWPPGPFCPLCHAQEVEWVAAGGGRIYSFTIVEGRDGAGPGIPLLVEFPQAGGVRLLAALVGATAGEVRIGAAVDVEWQPAANAMVPVFRLATVALEEQGRR